MNIPFRESLATFFNQLVENEDDTWMSIFERYNLEIVDTDLVLNDDFQREQESDEMLNNETAEDEHHLNAIELLSSLHKEKKHDKLGQRFIDVANDWTKNDGKISNTSEIENFLKTYKSVDIKFQSRSI